MDDLKVFYITNLRNFNINMLVVFVIFYKKMSCCDCDHPYIYFAKFGDVKNVKIENLKHCFIW